MVDGHAQVQQLRRAGGRAGLQERRVQVGPHLHPVLRHDAAAEQMKHGDVPSTHALTKQSRSRKVVDKIEQTESNEARMVERGPDEPAFNDMTPKLHQ